MHLIPLEDNVFVFAIWCSMHSRRFIFIVFWELHILHYKEEFGSHLITGSASRSAWVEEAQLGHRSDLFFVQYDDCVWHWASISVEIVGLSYRQWSLWGQYTAQAWGKATQARIRIYILLENCASLTKPCWFPELGLPAFSAPPSWWLPSLLS